MIRHHFDLKTGVVGDKGVAQACYHTALCLPDHVTVVGSHSGDIYVFKLNTLEVVIPAHTAPCGALTALPTPRGAFVSAGFDGHVKQWSADFQCVRDIDLVAVLHTHPDASFKIRAAHVSPDGSQVTVGTKESALIVVQLGEAVPDQPAAFFVAENHCNDTVSLATHPTRTHFVTGEGNLVLNTQSGSSKDEAKRGGGDDSTHLLYVMDYEARLPLPFSPIRVRHHVYCAAFSPDGSLLALGHEDGRVSVLDYDTQAVPHFCFIHSRAKLVYWQIEAEGSNIVQRLH